MPIFRIVLPAVLALTPLVAAAHDAPSGWQYDQSCCSGLDCRQISAADLRERPDGYFITIGNVVVPYGDKRIRNSPDGYVHWCTINGRNDSRTVCLYVPPRSY